MKVYSRCNSNTIEYAIFSGQTKSQYRYDVPMKTFEQIFYVVYKDTYVSMQELKFNFKTFGPVSAAGDANTLRELNEYFKESANTFSLEELYSTKITLFCLDELY